MKILHIYKDYYPILGGIENHIRALAEAQVSNGHQVTVLVTNPSSGMKTLRQVFNGVDLIRAGRIATLASTPISPALFFLCAKLRSDITHLHFPYPLGEIANLLFRPSRRTVITYHCDIVRQKTILKLYQPLLSQILRIADRILPTSPLYLETSPFLLPVQGHCEVVPLGVNLERFSPVSKAAIESVRNRYRLSGNQTILVFVGRLRYYKGLDNLLMAMRDVQDTRLLVIGDGPMKDEWMHLSSTLGLDDRVTFAGEVDDQILPACYAVGDIFVLPATSRAEAFGTVILEAMAMGLPVISTDIGTGTTWVNQDGITGLVVPPGDPEALAGALAELISDPGRRRRMGNEARKRVEGEFSQDRMVARIEAIYQKLMAACADSNSSNDLTN